MQRRTTFNNGRFSVQGFENEGVITPSSGLDEYILLLSNGGNKTINLNNDQHLLLEKIIGTGSSGDFSVTYNGISIVNATAVETVNTNESVIISPSGTLNITDTAGDKKIQIQLRRVGVIDEIG